MKYATSCYTWKDALISRRMTIDDSIKRSAEMGFDGYEITNLTDDWMDFPYDLSSMKRAAESAGIEIPSWCMAADWERGIRREADKAKEEMKMAEALGASVFRTDTYVAPTADPYAEEVIGTVRELADFAREHGMTLVTENHGTYLCTPERLLPLFEKVSHENFGLLYDGANFAGAGADPLEAAKMLAPLVRHVHIKDAYVLPGSRLFPGTGWFTALNGDYWRTAITGQGFVPYEEILPLLTAAGFDGYLVQEFDGLEDAEFAMREGLDYTKRLVETLK